MEHTVNQITVRGELTNLPVLSHENHGKRFYRFFLDIPRLSGTSDILPVIAEERVMLDMDLTGGELLTVTGQIRSHNVRNGGSRHLLIFIFASSVTAEDGPSCNDLILEGPLCKEPIYRRTPLGREICDAMLAVPRSFRRADYLPCIFWGRTAEDISLCHTGDIIRIEGRLQSRSYTKRTDSGAEVRIAYEVSTLTAQIIEQEM